MTPPPEDIKIYFLYSTVSVILKSFDDLSTLLREITCNRAFGADLRIEATGLWQSMSEPSFKSIAEMVQKILAYLDPPNKMLQSKDMDLLTGEIINIDGEKVYLLLSKIIIIINYLHRSFHAEMQLFRTKTYMH